MATIDRVCGLVAAGSPAAQVRAEFDLAPGSTPAEGADNDDWKAVEVNQDDDGTVSLVHLTPVAGALTLDELGALGPLEEVSVQVLGESPSHLLVMDDPLQPQLCRVVASADPDGFVTSLVLQPDIRL